MTRRKTSPIVREAMRAGLTQVDAEGVGEPNSKKRRGVIAMYAQDKQFVAVFAAQMKKRWPDLRAKLLATDAGHFMEALAWAQKKYAEHRAAEAVRHAGWREMSVAEAREHDAFLAKHGRPFPPAAAKKIQWQVTLGFPDIPTARTFEKAAKRARARVERRDHHVRFTVEGTEEGARAAMDRLSTVGEGWGGRDESARRRFVVG